MNNNLRSKNFISQIVQKNTDRIFAHMMIIKYKTELVFTSIAHFETIVFLGLISWSLSSASEHLISLASWASERWVSLASSAPERLALASLVSSSLVATL